MKDTGKTTDQLGKTIDKSGGSLLDWTKDLTIASGALMATGKVASGAKSGVNVYTQSLLDATRATKQLWQAQQKLQKLTLR